MCTLHVSHSPLAGTRETEGGGGDGIIWLPERSNITERSCERQN